MDQSLLLQLLLLVLVDLEELADAKEDQTQELTEETEDLPASMELYMQEVEAVEAEELANVQQFLVVYQDLEERETLEQVEQVVLQDFLQILQEIWILAQDWVVGLLVQEVEAVEQVGDLFQE